MTRSQISELRQRFIEQKQSAMKSKMSAVQKRLYDRIFSNIILRLEVDAGRVSSTGKNLNVVSDIDAIFKNFVKTDMQSVITQFGADLGKLIVYNDDYFRAAIDPTSTTRFDSVKKEVKSFMKKRIGVNTKNEIVSDGYLDRLLKDQAIKNKIKDQIVRGVTNRLPVDRLTKSLQNGIIGDPNVDGDLVKFFNQHMNDTYNQFDRLTSKMYAEKLDMKFFIYQGGKIKSSRNFCINHDGKCYTTKEAAGWKGLIGTKNGPIADKATYNPLVDCGGYNCRHSLDYISDSLAKRYRPELFVDSN
jgi:hypothetical protein